MQPGISIPDTAANKDKPASIFPGFRRETMNLIHLFAGMMVIVHALPSVGGPSSMDRGSTVTVPSSAHDVNTRSGRATVVGTRFERERDTKNRLLQQAILVQTFLPWHNRHHATLTMSLRGGWQGGRKDQRRDGGKHSGRTFGRQNGGDTRRQGVKRGKHDDGADPFEEAMKRTEAVRRARVQVPIPRQ